MKPKIFIIGFNKTGTRSLHYFFKNNGLKSVHWDNAQLTKCFERNIALGNPLLDCGVVHNTKVNSPGVYDEMVVISDMTNSITCRDAKDYYKRLDKDYPGSKFILNVRDVDSWIVSRYEHMNGQNIHEHLEFYGLSDTLSGHKTLKKIYMKMHEDYHRDTLRYFKNRDDDFLLFDLKNDNIDHVISFLKDDYKLDSEHYNHMGKTSK